jgi:hypothetical protein
VIGRQQLEWLIRNRPELTLEIMKRMSGWLAGAGAGKPPEPPSGAPPPRPGA